VTTEEFTIELFFRIDKELSDVEKHSQARLYPSEVIILAFLFALKGVAIAPFTAGWRATFTICFRICRSALDCLASFARTII
jgi:hypothetical protein